MWIVRMEHSPLRALLYLAPYQLNAVFTLTFMTPLYKSRAFEVWAPFIARLIFGLQFLVGALFKIVGHAGEVAQSAAVGIPLPEVAVWLAFIFELVAGVCLIIGYRTRDVAFILALYVLLLALLFYRHVSDPMVMGMFISHLGFIAGLLYVSVYGAKDIAVQKD
ncbi:MAG: LysR family transcriptional regulator [Parcubacteria group bacterium]|nr:LysR family transcriptional regulator [Parcubacteria group bacterium]